MIILHPAVPGAGIVGEPYDAGFAASGGIPPYSFSVGSGVLPPGLSLSAEGVLSGTPTTPGSYDFIVTVEDGSSPPQDISLTLLITSAVEIIVEDGTGLDDANSYVSLGDVETLAKGMGQGTGGGLSAWFGFTTEIRSLLIIQATAYLDRRIRFYGLTRSATQALQWPRTKNFDQNGRPILPGTIPLQLKKAQALLVLFLAQDADLQSLEIPSGEGAIKSLSVNTNGIALTYGGVNEGQDAEATTSSKEQQQVALFDTRLKDVEVLLRSIGEILPLDYLGPDRQTLVNDFNL